MVLAMLFLDLTPKTKARKGKVSKWDYIELKSFCTVKEAIKKLKRQPTDERKYFQLLGG